MILQKIRNPQRARQRMAGILDSPTCVSPMKAVTGKSSANAASLPSNNPSKRFPLVCGSATNTVPIPRLHLAKGIVENLEFVFSFFPATLDNGISTIGGLLKATIEHEYEQLVEVGVFVGFTHVSAFHDGFTGNSAEGGLLFSKDYVRIKPFFGAGVVGVRGGVQPSYAAGNSDSDSRVHPHFFLGCEAELPVNLALQVDLIGLSPAGSLFIGKRF